MIFFSTTSVLIQAVAALLIFVVGYLALLVFVIAGIVIAEVFYKCARFLWSRMLACAASAEAASARIAGQERLATDEVEILSHLTGATRRLGS